MDHLRRFAAYIWPQTRLQDAPIAAAARTEAAVPQTGGRLEEFSLDARPYVVQDGQLPNYIPYVSRFVEVNIAGQQRPAALLSREAIDAIRASAKGEDLYREDLETLRVNAAAQARYRTFFESADSAARTVLIDLMTANGNYEGAIRRVRKISRKLEQLKADESNTKANTDFVHQEAITHFKNVMDHLQPLLMVAGILPPYTAPTPEENPIYRHKYRLAYGDDDDSSDTSSRNDGSGVQGPEPGPVDGRDASNGNSTFEPAPLTSRETAAANYKDRRAELWIAQATFDNIGNSRRQEGAELHRRLMTGDAGVDDIAQFEASDILRGRTLTRNLIDAEERYRAAKAACQDERVNILDDDLSSVFPDISDDGTVTTDGIPTQEARDAVAPAYVQWTQDLPDLVDTVLAEQEEWTRRPEVDEWEAAPVMDYDSISLRGQGKKRKRIDAALTDSRTMHDQSVAQWVRDTNKRAMLFHERDRVLVFSKARE